MKRHCWLFLTLFAASCVPPDPPPPRPVRTPAAANAPAPVAPPEDPQVKQAARKDGLEGGTLVFEDNFDRAELGENWLVRHVGEWTLDEGQLRSHDVGSDDARNQGIWLQKPLPDKVRVTFQSKSMATVGDTKCEIFNMEAKHETGYSVIFGGWRNTINTIARRGEHETTRRVQSDHVPVETGKRYNWTIVRNDGVVRWYIDGKFMLSYDDAQPVRGQFFGFNNWASDLRFDNVQVYQL